MSTDDCPSSYPKFQWQLELPTPDRLRENRYGFLRLAPWYVLIVPMAFIARRAAKLAVVSLADVAGSVVGARDPSRWPLAAPSFNSASRAQGVMKLDLGSQRSVRPVPSPDYRDFYCCDTPTFMTPSGTLLLVREHLIFAHQLEDC